MGKIIAFFGKKQSGKGSCATLIAGLNLLSYRAIDKFIVADNHKLIIDDELIDVNDIAPNIVRIYSFADKLKWLVTEIFEVDEKLVFGTDEEKSYHTNLRWEDMPGVITNERLFKAIKKTYEKQKELYNITDKFSIIYREPGFLTGRELLQFFGSDICRTIYDDCWANYLIKEIKRNKAIFSIIADGRFDLEHDKLTNTNAFLIHLLRDVFNNSDKHKSENGLSKDKKFNLILDNRKLNKKETFKELVKNLKNTNILAPIV